MGRRLMGRGFRIRLSAGTLIKRWWLLRGFELPVVEGDGSSRRRDHDSILVRVLLLRDERPRTFERTIRKMVLQMAIRRRGRVCRAGIFLRGQPVVRDDAL